MTGVVDPVARAREVRTLGVSLVLYHRSIDEELTASALWDDKACRIVQDMCALGMDVAIAGGVNLQLLPEICSAPVYAIVIGRAITAQANPADVARAISQRVKDLWPA
jgi:3-hexulose-6-phosphate synthase/6-phospho-3-hexuloisomerase